MAINFSELTETNKGFDNFSPLLPLAFAFYIEPQNIYISVDIFAISKNDHRIISSHHEGIYLN